MGVTSDLRHSGAVARRSEPRDFGQNWQKFTFARTATFFCEWQPHNKPS